MGLLGRVWVGTPGGLIRDIKAYWCPQGPDMSLPWFKGPTLDSILALPVRGVEVQLSKSLSQSSPKPPT